MDKLVAGIFVMPVCGLFGFEMRGARDKGRHGGVRGGQGRAWGVTGSEGRAENGGRVEGGGGRRLSKGPSTS